MNSRLSDKFGFDVDNFLLEAQKGDIPGCSVIWRAGLRDTSDTILSDVWSVGGSYNFPTAAVPLYLWSTSASDTQTIFIEGLDANYEYQSELLVLTGTSVVTSTKTWLRVNDIHNISGTDLVGTVYSSRVSGSTTSSNLLATIPIGLGHSMMAMYTVPAGYTGYLFQGTISVGKGKNAVFYWRVKPFSKAFLVADSVSVYQQAIDISRPFIKVYEKSDVKVSVDLDLAALVQSSFGIVLLSNTLYGEQLGNAVSH